MICALLAPVAYFRIFSSHRGGEELLAGDAISIIRGDRSCKQRAHLDGTPAGVSNVILDAQKRAFFDFSELPPQTGYILCVCPASVMIEESGARICPDDVGFEEETTVDVQDLMTGINFKGTVAGTMVYSVLHTREYRHICFRLPLRHVKQNTECRFLLLADHPSAENFMRWVLPTHPHFDRRAV